MDVSIGFSNYDEYYKRNMNDISIEVFSNYGSWDDAFREYPHSPIYIGMNYCDSDNDNDVDVISAGMTLEELNTLVDKLTELRDYLNEHYGKQNVEESNMLVCDVCKKNKATRKITYPTMSPMDGVDYSRNVSEYKREDIEYDICQQCWDIIAINRDYVFRTTKEMIYNKINESEGDEE